MEFIKSFLKWLLAFSVIIFVFIIYAEWSLEEKKENEKAYYLETKDERKREAVVETLNQKFDLSNKPRTPYQGANGIEFDCKFRFRLGRKDNKITLIARFCESTSEYTKSLRLREVLTPENLALIKNAGFEQVVLYDRMESNLVSTFYIEQN